MSKFEKTTLTEYKIYNTSTNSYLQRKYGDLRFATLDEAAEVYGHMNDPESPMHGTLQVVQVTTQEDAVEV